MENVLENSRKDQELIYKAGNMPRPTGIEIVRHIRRSISVGPSGCETARRSLSRRRAGILRSGSHSNRR